MNSTQIKQGAPIIHRSAWRGTELFQSPFWQLTPPKTSLSELAVANAADWFRSVQDELENGLGAVLVRGIEVTTDTDATRELFLKFCEQIGTPVSQSASGEKVFSVRDEGYAADDARARGPNTKKKLSFHTDRCDVIGFFCLKQAKSGGENQVVSSVTLYNEMLARRPDLVKVLCQPYYYQRHNVDLANENPFTQQPIFSFFENRFASNFLRVLIERAYASGEVPAMTAVQCEALDYLEELAADPELHVTFHQQEGDLLLLNNWVTYHRRTEFEDHGPLELRRHLLRVWLSMPNSRAIDPMFAGNYGRTAAGAIRGGMHKQEKADQKRDR